MSLLDKASLIVTPNAYKESKLYSVVPNTTLGDMDVVRATTATRVNSAGLIEVVPRNLLSYSNDLTNGIWTKTNTTITLNTIANPLNGLVNGQTFTPNTTNADHFVFGSGTTIAGQSYVISFFVKANGYTNCRVGNAATGAGIWFNLSNGTIISGTGGTITALSNGWYLASYLLTAGGTSVNPLISFAPSTSTNFAGNGISGGYIFGAQLDQGSTATEYFPTTTRLNIPRIDYTNGSCPSLLVEPQRTNLFTYSEQFDNIAWTKVLSTITANDTTSPSGIVNADKYIPNTTNAFHPVYQTRTITSGVSYSFSIYVKSAGYNFLLINTVAGSSSGNVGPLFDLSNGTLIGSLGGNNYNAKITSVGNSWYKIDFSYITSGVITEIDINCLPTSSIASFAGNGTSGLYLWGAQLEAGSYATSYVPTVASTVTRNADVISRTGISSLIGQTEGTVFVDIYIKDTLNQIGASIQRDGNLNSIHISQLNNKATFTVRASNSSKLSYSNEPFLNGRNKAALTYNINGTFKVFLNGVKLTQTSISAFTFSNILSTLQLFDDNYYSAQNITYNNSTQLYKTALTDTECITLTTL